MRHLSPTKKIHWHIDHLTTNSNITFSNIFIIEKGEKNLEITLAKDLLVKWNGSVIAKGFGNSDTKETITHLLYRKTPLNYNHFISSYQRMVRFIPSSIETS